MNLMSVVKIKALLFLIPICCLGASVTVQKVPGDSDVSFAEATVELIQAIRKAEKFEVYEGLPHSFEGKDFVENEIRSKTTVWFEENWFYTPSRPMPAEDRANLQRLLEGGLVKPWKGFKFCGGFHADYAVRFESEDYAYLVLFCFGCHEARISRISLDSQSNKSSKEFRLTTDLAKDGFQELKELLKKYRKERPPTPAKKSKTKPPGPPPGPVRF